MYRLLILLTLIMISNHTYASYEGAQKIDGKFINIEPLPDKNFLALLEWKIRGIENSVSWPEKIKSSQFQPIAQRSDELIITVVNHATVLIQVDKINILTDPHFSLRASPLSFIGPKRVVKPGIALEDLPPIDIILISHNHYDHLDLKSLRTLSKKHKSKIYAGLETSKFLESEKIKGSQDLDWWKSVNEGSLKITFVPAQHWSARGLFDKREMLWGGFYINGTRSVYFAGDTGYGTFFNLIKERLGVPEISLLPIGAYEPRWFMKSAHMNPPEAIQAFKDLESYKMIGIHFGTFKLTDEGYSEPEEFLRKEIKKNSLDERLFIIPKFGRAIKI